MRSFLRRGLSILVVFCVASPSTASFPALENFYPSLYSTSRDSRILFETQTLSIRENFFLTGIIGLFDSHIKEMAAQTKRVTLLAAIFGGAAFGASWTPKILKHITPSQDYNDLLGHIMIGILTLGVLEYATIIRRGSKRDAPFPFIAMALTMLLAIVTAWQIDPTIPDAHRLIVYVFPGFIVSLVLAVIVAGITRAIAEVLFFVLHIPRKPWPVKPVYEHKDMTAEYPFPPELPIEFWRDFFLIRQERIEESSLTVEKDVVPARFIDSIKMIQEIYRKLLNLHQDPALAQVALRRLLHIVKRMRQAVVLGDIAYNPETMDTAEAKTYKFPDEEELLEHLVRWESPESIDTPDISRAMSPKEVTAVRWELEKNYKSMILDGLNKGYISVYLPKFREILHIDPNTVYDMARRLVIQIVRENGFFLAVDVTATHESDKVEGKVYKLKEWIDPSWEKQLAESLDDQVVVLDFSQRPGYLLLKSQISEKNANLHDGVKEAIVGALMPLAERLPEKGRVFGEISVDAAAAHASVRVLRKQSDANPRADLAQQLEEMFARQMSVKVPSDSLTRFVPVIKIIEDGQTADYLVVQADGSQILYSGQMPPMDVISSARWVIIQNAGRAERLHWAGRQAQRIPDDRPSKFHPDVLSRAVGSLTLCWKSVTSGDTFHLFYRMHPIWPPEPKRAQQVHHLVAVWAGPLIHQARIAERRNLFTLVELYEALNKSGKGYRLGVNGWYTSPDPQAPKGGASSTLGYAHIVDLPFSIEQAEFSKVGSHGLVQVSQMVPQPLPNIKGGNREGSVLLLECPTSSLEQAIPLLDKALIQIAKKGDSYNFMFAPGPDQSTRLFIFDRPVGTPYPYFENEWGMSEVARSPVVDNPADFFDFKRSDLETLQKFSPARALRFVKERRKERQLKLALRPDLIEKVEIAWNMVNATPAEIAAIAQSLVTQDSLTSAKALALPALAEVFHLILSKFAESSHHPLSSFSSELPLWGVLAGALGLSVAIIAVQSYWTSHFVPVLNRFIFNPARSA